MDRKKYLLFAAFLLLILVGLVIVPLKSLNDRGVIVILIAAVFLWNSRLIPATYASFLVLVLMALGGGAGNLEQVLAGFASPGLFFLLTVTLIGISFARKGLISYIVLRWAGLCHNIWTSRLFCIGISLFLPLLIPSAAARTRLTEPIIKELAKKNGFGQNGWFVRSTALIIGGMSSVATVAYMTGGGNSIMAAELMNSFTSINLSWFLWLVLMLPLAWLIIFLCTFLLPALFPGQEVTAGPKPETAPAHKKLTFQEIAALGIVMLLIVLWISEPLTGIDPVIVAFTGVVLLALPGINILREEDVREVDWQTIILLGTAFSLGKMISTSGVGDTITAIFTRQNTLIYSDYPGLSFLLMLILLYLARVLFVSPVTFVALALPIVIPVAGAMGLNPVYLGLATTILAAAVNVLPTQSPGLMMLNNNYQFKFREFLCLSCVSTTTALAVIVFAYFIYWPWLFKFISP